MHKAHDSFEWAISDRIFLGEGLFETIKVLNGKPCLSRLHWQRLNDSASRLGIPFTLPIDKWDELLQQKIHNDSLCNGGIKVILSGGEAPRGLIAHASNPRLLVDTFSYEMQQKPVHLRSASWLRDANNPVYQLKTINYLEAIVARREAVQEGADDALFLNMEQYITEATCANLFILYKDCLITPPISDGVLPGITRLRVLQQAEALDYAYAELSITKEMLQSAQAVFLTNALQGIQYVGSWDGYQFPVEHPLVERLKRLLDVGLVGAWGCSPH